MTPERAAALLAAMSGRRVLVAGDFVVDHYVFGRPARLSREAPVIILEHDGEEWTPGGAGNAARNVAALGGRALVLGVVGDDGDGVRLRDALAAAGASAAGLVTDPSRRTVAKTRVLAGGVHSAKQQVLRIDRGERGAVGAAARAAMLDRADALLAEADALLLSDYGYGTLFPELRSRLLAGARERRIPSCADSRFDLLSFRGVDVATPNEAEAAAAVGAPSGTDDEVDRVGAALIERLAARALLVTRGSRGMCLYAADGTRDAIPVIGPDEVADVTGAGDTVASALVLALAAGGAYADAARIANAAASVVVMKRGAATASSDEVRRVLEAVGADAAADTRGAALPPGARRAGESARAPR